MQERKPPIDLGKEEERVKEPRDRRGGLSYAEVERRPYRDNRGGSGMNFKEVLLSCVISAVLSVLVVFQFAPSKADLTGSISQVQSSVKSLDDRNVSDGRRIDNLTNLLGGYVKSGDLASYATKAEINSFGTQVNQLGSQVQNLATRDSVSSLSSQVSDLKSQIDSSKRSVDQLSTTVTSLQSQLQTLTNGYNNPYQPSPPATGQVTAQMVNGDIQLITTTAAATVQQFQVRLQNLSSQYLYAGITFSFTTLSSVQTRVTQETLQLVNTSGVTFTPTNIPTAPSTIQVLFTQSQRFSVAPGYPQNLVFIITLQHDIPASAVQWTGTIVSVTSSPTP